MFYESCCIVCNKRDNGLHIIVYNILNYEEFKNKSKDLEDLDLLNYLKNNVKEYTSFKFRGSKEELVRLINEKFIPMLNLVAYLTDKDVIELVEVISNKLDLQQNIQTIELNNILGNYVFSRPEIKLQLDKEIEKFLGEIITERMIENIEKNMTLILEDYDLPIYVKIDMSQSESGILGLLFKLEKE